MAEDAVRVFISYSHKDEALRDSLDTHLSNLQWQGIISSWYDRQLTAGTQWDDKIKAELESANIILLLISPDFIASKYCRDVEIPMSLARHESKQAYVVPIILRPFDWFDAPFAKLQAFPKDAKPVTTWTNQDEAFVSVTQGIRTAAKLMLDYRKQEAEQKQLIRAQYLQKVEEVLSDGQISIVERDTLDELRDSLGLTSEEAKEIETRAYEPYSRVEENLNKYKQTLNRLIEKGYYPFSEEIEKDLENRQRDLGLKPEDAARISKPILDQAELNYQAQKKQLTETESLQKLERQRQQEREEYKAKLERYRQEFSRAIEAEYPLSQFVVNELKTFQQQLGLKDEDVAAIASPILAAKQVEYERQQTAARQVEQASQRNQPIPVPTIPSQTPSPPSKSVDTIPTQTFEFATATLTIVQKPGWLGSKSTVEISRDKGRASYFTEDLGNGVTLEMVKIPSGEFLMGTATGEKSSSSDEMPQHRVKLPEFWMGKFAVTQAQWSQVAGLLKVKLDLDADPSNFKGAKRPVEQVSWDEAVEFCDRLFGKTGKSYRLPSEAEWEYACRAGTTTPFYFGETITAEWVNCAGTSPYGNAPKSEYRQQTTDVGSFPANAFGLFDMHGNVWEWCADQGYGSYANKPDQLKQNGAIAWTEKTTGIALKSDETNYRLLRGGSWVNLPWNCRSANRYRDSRALRLNFIGFRVVCLVSRTL